MSYSNSRQYKLKTAKQSFSKRLVFACNFVFVLGNEDREKGYCVEQDTFIVMSYDPKGHS